MRAARYGRTDVVEELIKRGGDVNAQDKVRYLIVLQTVEQEGGSVVEVGKLRGEREGEVMDVEIIFY